MKSVYLLKDWQEAKRSTLYQNNNGSTITVELRWLKSICLELSAYVFLKKAAIGVWEGRFCWIWVKISQFFNYNNSGVRPKNFIVYMLKRSCLGLIRNTLCASRCIRVSETNHHRCLIGSFTEFEWEYHKFSSTKTGEWDLKILLFNY